VRENLGSTILNCQDGQIEIVRKGAGVEILARLGLEEFVSQEAN